MTIKTCENYMFYRNAAYQFKLLNFSAKNDIKVQGDGKHQIYLTCPNWYKG